MRLISGPSTSDRAKIRQRIRERITMQKRVKELKKELLDIERRIYQNRNAQLSYEFECSRSIIAAIVEQVRNELA